MSRSVAALFKRLTQGVYVVGVAHGEDAMQFEKALEARSPKDLASLVDHVEAAAWRFLTRK